MKDNIQICYLDLGWDECKTQLSKGGLTLSIADLNNSLKDLMILKKNKWVVPEKPDVLVPQRRDMSIIGQRTNQVLELDLKENEHKEDIDTKARGTWRKQNEEGFGSMHTIMQQPDAPRLESLIGMRIKYLSSIDMEKAGSEKMCSGWMVQLKEEVMELS